MSKKAVLFSVKKHEHSSTDLLFIENLFTQNNTIYNYKIQLKISFLVFSDSYHDTLEGSETMQHQYFQVLTDVLNCDNSDIIFILYNLNS